MTNYALTKNSLNLLTEIRRSFGLADFRGGVLVVAVSGGRDSVALLQALAMFELKLEIIAAHFDHKLRASSSEDLVFVKQLAEQLGVKFIGEEVQEPFSGGENVEAWARERRYEFLERVRMENDASLILTAHHRDDECETILFRLLSGRLATRALSVSRYDPKRQILRPWLSVPREVIEEFVTEMNLSYREDETNSDVSRTRNRLRRELIPQLEQQYNPNLRASLAELAERFSQDEQILWEEASRWAAQLKDRWNEGGFIQLPGAIRWRVLSLLLSASARELGYRKLKLLENRILAAQGESFSLDLGSGMRVGYKRGQGLSYTLYFHR